MKYLILLVVSLGAMVGCAEAQTCSITRSKIEPWSNLNCSKSIVEQIHREMSASLTYLAMGAYFSSDGHYRPGIATFFLEGASEERQHAKALMEYVLLRGKSVDISDIQFNSVPTKRAWDSVMEALKDAMQIEKDVRQNFKDIIGVCENFDSPSCQGGCNDYHAADMLTGIFLEEQHESIRKIGEHLTTLSNMQMAGQYGNFAEIMFDRTLIK
jgi:ferritin